MDKFTDNLAILKTQHRGPSLKGTKLILLFTLCHIYPYIRSRRVMRLHYAPSLERAYIHRSTRRKSERAMRKHRSFCLPESEQASRQARQEPDGMTVRASGDGLSGSGIDG